MFFQKLTNLLRVASAALSFPFREGTRRVGVVEMGFADVVETGNEGTDAEGTNTSFLGVFLFGLSDMFGDVLDGRAVVIVKSVALALDTGLVCQDTSVSCQARVSHMDVVVELDDLLDCATFLQLSDCFFLN